MALGEKQEARAHRLRRLLNDPQHRALRYLCMVTRGREQVRTSRKITKATARALSEYDCVSVSPSSIEPGRFCVMATALGRRVAELGPDRELMGRTAGTVAELENHRRRQGGSEEE